ncbi:MotA/TolQ/ExbB proton channel family protein [Alteromonas sediminis]|uniref:MotA/TolQ/ExbB proton channel family protein n=1 Tax=Alteromonas sediminis TaxID=2259342 RepID=A0A3N5Y088_9ALTE|nr:MotA/TolQ/ExbB proton channel family protein [Alteromonas sediminis]RPJ65856.1 MotA/TolQ/ExbB proton channel family protein [Alteromonas sediminis]
MFVLIDNTFPWFGDMLELGGDILLMIILMAALMWALILERLVFMLLVLPSRERQLLTVWQQLSPSQPWYNDELRSLLVSRVSREVKRNLGLIQTIVKVCPLLGLLGTVMGMLEIFDALAVTGNNSARTTAGGVSKATVSTMAGMVVAISGLMISNYLSDKADSLKLAFQERLQVSSNKETDHA